MFLHGSQTFDLGAGGKRMYLLFLAFGGLLTAAGAALAASGVSLHDRTIDASIVTPGVVAAVGGLLLIGLGLALRLLQRIEQALAFRPMPRAIRPGEAAEPAIPAGLPESGRNLPFAKTTPRPLTAGMPAPPAPAPAPAGPADGRPGDLLEKTAARLESPVKEAEPSLSPKLPFVPPSADQPDTETDRALRGRNGGSPRPAPRLDLTPRSPLAADRPAGPAFDTLWPKGSRPIRAAQPAPAAAAPLAEAERGNEPATTPPTPDETPAPVSVLKSGVVDGMAYKLYSDGSIEAQLPQGTLRFGSITELRNHIEQSA